MLLWLDARTCPDPESADETGLVAISPHLDPDMVLLAYRAGLFPWSSDPVVTWWSPGERAVFELPAFRLPRSARQQVARAGWTFAVDRDFRGVMRACGAPAPGRESTWISDDFVDVYGELHRRGYAHSVEVYEGDALVGGLYGVAIGGFFGGESMFHQRPGASKAALAHLVERLRSAGYALLDAQVMTPHLRSLGAVGIPRRAYLRRLAAALRAPVGPAWRDGV